MPFTLEASGNDILIRFDDPGEHNEQAIFLDIGANNPTRYSPVEVVKAAQPDQSQASALNNSLNSFGSISFNDVDLANTGLLSTSFISATPNNGASLPDELNTALQDLSSAFTLSGDGVSTAARSGSADWTFSIDNDLTQYLAAGESITATYRITLTDNSEVDPASGSNELNAATQDVVITITGTNDAPTVSAITSTKSEDDSSYVIDLLSTATDTDASDLSLIHI